MARSRSNKKSGDKQVVLLSGRVYFIKDTGTRSIKIGFSKTPEKRLADLQTANANKLMILGTIPGTPKDETLLHDRFSEHRLEGEWFKGDEIIEVVMEMISASIQGDNMSETDKEQTADNSELQGISQITGLKMKGLSVKLSERQEKNYGPTATICRLEMKYLLEFENNVVDEELAKLRQAAAGDRNTTKLRHVFFDADNAVVPFLLGIHEPDCQHIVGGPQAITGVAGEAFRVLLVVEKRLDSQQGWKGADVFIGTNYIGEHPLNKAKKMVVHIRG